MSAPVNARAVPSSPVLVFLYSCPVVPVSMATCRVLVTGPCVCMSVCIDIKHLQHVAWRLHRVFLLRLRTPRTDGPVFCFVFFFFLARRAGIAWRRFYRSDTCLPLLCRWPDRRGPVCGPIYGLYMSVTHSGGPPVPSYLNFVIGCRLPVRPIPAARCPETPLAPCQSINPLPSLSLLMLA